MISEAWESISQLTQRRSWRKLFSNISTGGYEIVSINGYCNVTIEFSNIFSTMTRVENSRIEEITDWLNCNVEDEGSSCLTMRKLSQKSDILQKKPKKKILIKVRIIPKKRLVTMMLLTVYQKALLGLTTRTI